MFCGLKEVFSIKENINNSYVFSQTPELSVIYLWILIYVYFPLMLGLQCSLFCCLSQIHLSTCLSSSPYVVYFLALVFSLLHLCVSLFYVFHLGTEVVAVACSSGCGPGGCSFHLSPHYTDLCLSTTIRCSLSFNRVIPLYFNSIWPLVVSLLPAAWHH